MAVPADSQCHSHCYRQLLAFREACGGGRKDRVLEALEEAAKRLPKWSLGSGSKAFGGVSFLLPFSSHCSADLLAMPRFDLVRA